MLNQEQPFERAESAGRKWNNFASTVVSDAHQRLALDGIELTDYEMISWAAIYFRLKVDESGRAGFFNILRAIAVSEAACELEFSSEGEGDQ